MITLPSPPRRAWLMGFWLAISLCTGLLTGLLFALLLSPRWFGLGALLALLSSLVGVRFPQALARPYRVWNRLARRFGLAACLWLNGICFYIVFVAVGQAGSSLSLSRPPPTQSLWVPRETLAPNAYVSPHRATAGGLPAQGWMSTFVSWAVHSGNGWTLAVLPFFILLSALKIDENKNNVPANIYTLF